MPGLQAGDIHKCLHAYMHTWDRALSRSLDGSTIEMRMASTRLSGKPSSFAKAIACAQRRRWHEGRGRGSASSLSSRGHAFLPKGRALSQDH